MSLDCYSPYKIVHHQDKIKQLKAGEQTNPLQVQLVLSNRCNHRCSFCAYRMKDYLSNETFNDQDMLSYEKISEIINDCSDMGIKAIQITGGGEPTVHPLHKQVFTDILDKGMELALVSNGMALKEETCDILGDSSWVRISVDSSNPVSYSMIRNVNQQMFFKTINNIKNLVKYKRKNIIGVGFVLNKENYQEVYDAAKLFKEIGVDNFRISAAFTPMVFPYFKDIIEESKDLSRKAEELTDGNFKVFNLFNDRVKDMFEGTQDYKFCGTKELLAYIGADYNVYTCCTLAYNNKGKIGSIKEQSFKDLWIGEEKQKMFHNHSADLMCQHPCMYKNKNLFLNYCIKDNPQHINFI